MFILRKINGKGVESNTCLGNSYNLITENQEEEFEKTVNLNVYYQLEKDKIHAFVIHNFGSEIIPLFKTQQNYIMTGEGKTFSNVTFKD